MKAFLAGLLALALWVGPTAAQAFDAEAIYKYIQEDPSIWYTLSDEEKKAISEYEDKLKASGKINCHPNQQEYKKTAKILYNDSKALLACLTQESECWKQYARTELSYYSLADAYKKMISSCK